MTTEADRLNSSEWENCLNIGIFSALEPDVRKCFARFGTVEELPIGSFVAKQGKPQEFMAVVIAGEVSVSCHAHGDIVHLTDVGPGGLVGEMSLVDHHAGSADVVVKGKSARLWMISHTDFATFLESNPSVGLKVYQIIAAELCRLLRCNSESMLHNKDTMRSRFLDMDY